MNEATKRYYHEKAQTARPGEIILDRWVKPPKKYRKPKPARTFKVEPESQPMSMQDALESMPQYWIPGRRPDGPRASDAAITRRSIQDIDSDLDLAFNPVKRTYAVFQKAPIKTWWCRGWRFLFECHPNELDNRVLAAIYKSDTSRFGGAKKAFERVMSEIERQDKAVDNKYKQETRDWAGDWWDHSLIRTGYGKSSGSKFADFHAGD